jgi:hypothetical protein
VQQLSRSPCIIRDTGMPVARDTTSAISSAPTCVRSSADASGVLLLRFGLRPASVALELRQLAVLQFGDLPACLRAADARCRHAPSRSLP